MRGHWRPAARSAPVHSSAAFPRCVRILFACGLCVLRPDSAEAFDPRKAIPQYVHEVWKTEQGLPINSITPSPRPWNRAGARALRWRALHEIQELVVRGITAGCGPGHYCPNDPVNRGQMAVFLSRMFALPLPLP